MAQRNSGAELEDRVARLLKLEGFKVKVGTRVFDRFGNLSEIDVIGEKRGWLARFWPSIFRRRAAKVVPWGASSLWVECKNYRAGNTVTLDDVAKFKSVLDLNNVPHARGLFVTTSDFRPRALTIGIQTVNGAQLERWERSARRSRLARHLFAAGVALPASAALLLLLALRQQHHRLHHDDDLLNSSSSSNGPGAASTNRVVTLLRIPSLRDLVTFVSDLPAAVWRKIRSEDDTFSRSHAHGDHEHHAHAHAHAHNNAHAHSTELSKQESIRHLVKSAVLTSVAYNTSFRLVALITPPASISSHRHHNVNSANNNSGGGYDHVTLARVTTAAPQSDQFHPHHRRDDGFGAEEDGSHASSSSPTWTLLNRLWPFGSSLPLAAGPPPTPHPTPRTVRVFSFQVPHSLSVPGGLHGLVSRASQQ